MTNQNQHDRTGRITSATADTPATSAKESNETDIQMKSERAAFQAKEQTSEKV
ncbi:hypothetical protein [Paenibacillus turpanensis]|uniref:hypothetical protein n=1 Tax=Paenibacillus turpanensis TaxID=2689078 RepID=UPI00140AE684|nr:hypothetical protein [Paenibacillus turpanensis]